MRSEAATALGDMSHLTLPPALPLSRMDHRECNAHPARTARRMVIFSVLAAAALMLVMLALVVH